MEFKDKAKWEEMVRINKDPYSSCCVRYAERWAELMEQKMVEGSKLDDIADAASHEADTEGITGFMYGCAVGMLSDGWKYGEELRRWHNLKTQIQHEGEDANRTGGVLNPALLNITTKEVTSENQPRE